MIAGMTFATVINLVLVLLCLCVLVQSVRIDRRIRALRRSGLDEAVAKLDAATQHARLVLTDLRHVLSTDVAARSNGSASAEAMRDELADMVDIGNAVADRIMDAARQAQAVEAGIRRRPARSDDLFIDDVADAGGKVRGISAGHFSRGSAVA
jgi:hypothetical protein